MTLARPADAACSGGLRRLAAPLALFAGQFLAACWLRHVAGSFALTAPHDGRRYAALFATLGLSFTVYYAAACYYGRRRSSRGLVAWVLVSSALLRLPLLDSPPVLEIDLYRYLWDGAVAREGINPYRYAPAEAIAATGDPLEGEGLRRLFELRTASPGVEQALRAVHFSELTTIYPR